jgi:hypothetical protein
MVYPWPAGFPAIMDWVEMNDPVGKGAGESVNTNTQNGWQKG